MKSPVTRQKYTKRLEKFFDYLGLEGNTIELKSYAFLALVAKEGDTWVFSRILSYMQFQLDRANRKEITGSTIQNHLKCIKLFCEMAEISVNWKKISRGLPKGKRYADDRIPSDEESKKLMEYPDRRIKAIVSTMSSSGIRLGAWDYLKWNHVRPIDQDGTIIAAKIVVYAGEEDEHFTFITREAYFALKDWIDYRNSSGERIDGDSWLMRDLWDTRVAQGRGSVSVPKKLTSAGIKRLINRALWAQGLRNKLPKGKKRHPFQALHSFRKWFKTRAEMAGMRPIHTEMLLSHSIGISNSYYRPTEAELLQDYVKISESLIINNTKEIIHELSKQEQKNQEETRLIKLKLCEKDEQISSLMDNQKRINKIIQSLIDAGQLKPSA